MTAVGAVSDTLGILRIEVAMLAEIVGPDLLIVLLVVASLFGSSRLPKLARSLGSAKREFESGMAESEGTAEKEQASNAAPRAEGQTTRQGMGK